MWTKSWGQYGEPRLIRSRRVRPAFVSSVTSMPEAVTTST
jgi:hypothetical protein